MAGMRLTGKDRRFAVLLLVAFCVSGGEPGRAAGEPSQRADKGPLSGAQPRWTVSRPLVGPVDHGGDRCYSIKDPSVVRYDGRWHLFCTVRGKRRTHQIEYLSFADWKDAGRAKRHLLDLTEGYYCAPQVFFFSPQKKWYLIYQVQDPSRRPSLQPAYSTSDDLSDPKSWSKPKLLFDEHPANVKMWIDFWVICDREKAHLFFTSHAGWMWRSETQLGDFPDGWSEPKVVLKGDIFEASHTYRVKGTDQFLTLVEARDVDRKKGSGLICAQHPSGRSGKLDSDRKKGSGLICAQHPSGRSGKLDPTPFSYRYFKAFTADRLDGDWSPLGDGPFVSLRNVRFLGPHWTDSFSHGEFLRAGYDGALEIDPDNLRILFQGVETGTEPDENYGTIPWKLGILAHDGTATTDRPEAASPRKPGGPFPYKRWTVGKPIFKAGEAGTFDDVSVKDPSIVRHNGNWHVFYTSKPSRNARQFVDGVGYVSAPTLAGLNRAKRHNINAIVGDVVIAPQIFYFRPHKLWYLIAQTPCDGPSELEPIYLTNPDIADVDGWSNPRIIKTNRRDKDAFWIDFWVICDRHKAHLFYTDHAGSMFRLETPIDRFPQGFAEAREHLAVTVRGNDETGPWRLHEASHIYRVRDGGKYLVLLEAVRPHPTKRNYWDSRNRFMFAMVADSLQGPWERVEEGENDFLGIPAHVYCEDGSRTNYDQISHPELIRAGFDERLEIEDNRLRILFQAFDADSVPDTYDYNLLPWELSVMRNYY
jgi:glycosyl hydrolase family 62